MAAGAFPARAERANGAASEGAVLVALDFGRDGTTVEMACLYTIWVTVFLSNTTYWSNDSIWPWSLIPLTR